MKRSLIIALVASALLCACNYELEPLIKMPSGAQTIGFIPMVTTQTSTGSGSDFTDKTRATPTDITSLREDGFTVYAYSSEDVVDWTIPAATAALYPDWMFEQDVDWNASEYGWQYSPVTFWPQFKLLSFFAFSPFSAATSSPMPGQTGAPTIDFETPLMIDKQVDLVAGTDLNKKGTTFGDVNVIFKHTLSKIGFSARLDMETPAWSSDVLHVHSLKVYFAKDGTFRNKGTYSFVDATNPWRLDATSTFEGLPTVDLEWGEDKDNLTTTTCIWAGDVVSLDEYPSFDPSRPHFQGVPVPSPTTVTSLNDGSDFLMLLPQYYDENTIFIEVTYTTSEEASLDVKVLPIPQIKSSAEGSVIPFEPGKQYTFLLTLSTIRDIIFGGVQVGDWNDGGYFYFDF